MTHYTVEKDFQLTRKSVKKGEKKPIQSDNFVIAKYVNVGYYLLTPLIMGVFFGLMIDRYLGTSPSFTLGLLILGIVATFYNLWKLVKES